LDGVAVPEIPERLRYYRVLQMLGMRASESWIAW